MRAMTMPNVDRSTIEGLTPKLPSVREAGEVVRDAGGKGAEALEKGAEALRRWRSQAIGRAQPRRPARPWIATGVFMIALLGVVAALLTWSRRAEAETPSEKFLSAGATDPVERLDAEVP